MKISISRSMNDNLTEVNVGDVTLWFSYETIIAYRLPNGERVVSENVWSPTTNRHMNAIDGGSKRAKAARVPFQEFTRRVLAEVLQRYSVVDTGVSF